VPFKEKRQCVRLTAFKQVFLVSSLNHHISILKLTVHVAYLDYLRSETMPTGLPDDAAAWCRPKVQRTRWYDFFDEPQRIEAFRGLWGVTAYLTREPAPLQAAGDANGIEEAKSKA